MGGGGAQLLIILAASSGLHLYFFSKMPFLVVLVPRHNVTYTILTVTVRKVRWVSCELSWSQEGVGFLLAAGSNLEV